MTSSYIHIVKGGSQAVNGEAESFPALVLDEDCCNSKDLDCTLFGRVKEFASLANLKMVLKNEGSMDFNIDERVAWVEIEGVPFKMWSANTFRRIASKWGTLIHVDGQDEECFHRKRLCLNTKVPDFMDDSGEESDTDGDTNSEGPIGEDDYKCGNESKVEVVLKTKFEEELDGPVMEEVSSGQNNYHSGDPFNLYDLLNKKNTKDDKGDKSDNSIKYPPGFTPVNVTDGNEKKDESNKDSGDFIQSKEGEEANVGVYEITRSERWL
ncbi:RNA-directed DNA polymerase, eukaryota [Tanacetum coccineum]